MPLIAVGVAAALLSQQLPPPVSSPAAAILSRFDPELPRIFDQLIRDLDACSAAAGSVQELMRIVWRCGETSRRASEAREKIRLVRWREGVTLDEQRALAWADAEAEAIGLYAANEQKLLDSELPDLPLGQSSFAVTMQIFAGLLRIQRIAPEIGALGGGGGGVKLRYDYVHANVRREAIGINLGLLVDKPVNDYSLSSVLLLSTFSYFYGGIGVRMVGATGGLTFSERLFFVLGVGADGASLTN